MKRFLVSVILMSCCSVSALAGDINLAATRDWSGLYVGVYGAYGYGTTDSNDGQDSHPQDPFGGIHGGYMMQKDAFVVGVEGDLSLADLDGDVGSGAKFVSQDIDNLAGVRFRGGIDVGDALLFASGGWAWANSERNTLSAVDHVLLNGPSLGLGVEYALDDHFIGRLEYIHSFYGEVTYDLPGKPRVDSGVDVVKIGVDYQFQ